MTRERFAVQPREALPTPSDEFAKKEIPSEAANAVDLQSS